MKQAFPKLITQLSSHSFLKSIRFNIQWVFIYSPIALVSSRLAFRMENLNLALTSDLLHETSSR